MPLNNFARPIFPYVNQPLPNDRRFQIITTVEKRAVKFFEFEWENNYLIDSLNKLDLDMQGIAAGIIPGSANILNAGKLPQTDGLGNISWVNVTNDNILDQSISGLKITPSTIGTLQLGNGVVTPDKIPNLSLPYTKMNFDDGVIPGDKIFNKSITQLQLGLLSVGTPELMDANVTLIKMAADSVGTIQLIDANITLTKMAANSVGTLQLIDANVTTPKVADGAITLPKIAANVLTPAASKAQQIAAASNTVYTNPSVQQHHPSAAKFWCKFNGTLVGTNPPIAGYNVTSVTRVSAGNYIINYIVPFSTANYSLSGSSINIPSYYLFVGVIGQNPSNCNIVVAAPTGPGSIAADSPLVNCIGFGLQ